MFFGKKCKPRVYNKGDIAMAVLDVIIDQNGWLYGVVRKCRIGDEDAKDIVQQTMYKVYDQMNNNPLLLERFDDDIAFFENDLFRTLLNNINDFRWVW